MSENDKLNILSILESIDKIFRYSANYGSADDFHKNEKEFDASMMNFIIIGEMVSRFSDLFIEENNQIDWFKIKGFRNIIAHDYFIIDAEEVWQIIKKHLPQLKSDLHDILEK
jgi:uncharacterized protein with HEPN domain